MISIRESVGYWVVGICWSENVEGRQRSRRVNRERGFRGFGRRRMRDMRIFDDNRDDGDGLVTSFISGGVDDLIIASDCGVDLIIDSKGAV